MIPLACPRCHVPLQDVDAVTKQCAQEDLTFHCVEGVWRMLPPGREEKYARFTRDYETVRRAEGRGSTDATYYRDLPYHPSEDWKIRAASFDAFVKRVLVLAEEKSPLQILDLGAGNGWLSNRLAARGHHAAAVDLMVNDFDGLGCHRFFETEFLPMQAEFDSLPFHNHSIDMIIFNASLHYSTNYETTLTESLRTLKSTGLLVILDSPVYRNPKSGRQMVREREAQFTAKYGFASNSLPSENYLTYARLDELGRALDIRWKFITPFYGLRWWLRPLASRTLGRREPARFHVLAGSRQAD